MTSVLGVALGGAIGAVLRYALVSLPIFAGTSHWGVATVNLLGAFGIGVGSVWIKSESLKLLLVTGFFGSFTTMSTYALDALNLLSTHQFTSALFYVSLNCIGCIGAAWLGWILVSY